MEPAINDPLGEYANQYVISEVYQQGYSVDNVKGRIALDVEWNPKDGNLDRDFSAYRAWHEEGLIDVCVLFTRMHEDTKELADSIWAAYVKSNPQYKNEKQTVDYRTTTTANYEKARERVLRGDLGTCPILVVGIGKAAWDNIPWDGKSVKYDKETKKLYLEHTFDKNASKFPYPLLI